MKTIYHSAETRGNANHGWLKANHSFSFAQYHDPEGWILEPLGIKW